MYNQTKSNILAMMGGAEQPRNSSMSLNINNTVMIQSFRTDRSEQTVWTHIRLLHCLQCPLHPLDTLVFDKTALFKF